MSDSFIVRSTDLRKGPPPAPVEPEPLCNPADLVQCEHTEGQTFGIIGQVRFLGPKMNLSMFLQKPSFDWQTVNLYEVPAGMECKCIAHAKQLGRLTSKYSGDSGFNVMNCLRLILMPETNYEVDAAEFIKIHACACPICWNALYQTRAYWDDIEVQRHTTFTKKWWNQQAKDTIVGGAILYKLRGGQ